MNTPKTQQKWTDVKDTIYGYFMSAGLDVENNELYKKVYESVCLEIDEKIQRVWMAERFSAQIRERILNKEN